MRMGECLVGSCKMTMISSTGPVVYHCEGSRHVCVVGGLGGGSGGAFGRARCVRLAPVLCDGHKAVIVESVNAVVCACV